VPVLKQRKTRRRRRRKRRGGGNGRTLSLMLYEDPKIIY
jgi:hypothetical protein